ncbi:MAG TPA: signal peptidase II [Elainellaceae cyanobacterium]
MRIKNRFFWIAAFVALVIDQITKYWVVQAFELNETVPIWNQVFELTYITNPGAAFSLFSEGGGWLRWLSLIVSIGLMALAWFGPLMNRLEQAGYGFILGGALGNGIDRFAAGEVIDFLKFCIFWSADGCEYWFPIFNFADVSINIGIICLLYAAFRPPQRPSQSSRSPKPPSSNRL